ncbi:nucleotide sugar dehydrogenase [Nocardioides sp. MAHUQ-72]|uniref:nucleotide sugar dehydrogenase n=1 Tax=unclassified Nocardioides TaxID=2615069 RepID=UPI00360B3E44
MSTEHLLVNDLVVLGLGYVGLPLALEATRAGLTVRGLDVNERVVADLNGGISHIDDLSDDDISAMLAGGFTATCDASALRTADTIVICVPTPLSEDGGPDLGAVKAATSMIAENLKAGSLVVLESTTYPGTTEELVVPLLEKSGLRVGVDVNVAFSPERVDPGNPTYNVKNTPKIVGGITTQCTKRAATFYRRFIDVVVPARGTREAETAKLLENTFRHINIALMNEMARFCHELDIDLWNVIDLAKTKPFGFQAFYPGPGVGGHCIPIDPNYLSHNVRSRLGYPFRFVELAQEINATMPAYVVRRGQDLLNNAGKALNGATVLLLGVTYKPDIADQRESPAVDLARHLKKMGASVQFHDPYVTKWLVGEHILTPVEDLQSANAAADLVILVQNHKYYPVDELAESAQLFFDTRGATSTDKAARL